MNLIEQMRPQTFSIALCLNLSQQRLIKRELDGDESNISAAIDTHTRVEASNTSKGALYLLFSIQFVLSRKLMVILVSLYEGVKQVVVHALNLRGLHSCLHQVKWVINWQS